MPCEVQLRTNAQHLWALLSRELLYDDHENSRLERQQHLKALELSKVLDTAEALAKEIANTHARDTHVRDKGLAKNS